LLGELAQIDANEVALGQVGSRQRFQALSHPRVRNLLRHYLRAADAMLPEMARLEDGLRQLAGEGAVRWVFWHSAVCAYRDRIWLEPAVIPLPQAQVWQGQRELLWAGGRLCFPESFENAQRRSIRVGVRQTGMHWRLGTGRPLRAFKLLCQDVGVPPWWRELLPCVWEGEELLWIGGLGAASTDGLDWVGGWPACMNQAVG